ncbi:MAG: hypothetical protein IE934_08835 [Sphingopyxis sp.]|nr:hypothetical protein [Sphingopyxis sp.]
MAKGGGIVVDCRCGHRIVGTDEQEARQLWAAHVATPPASPEQPDERPCRHCNGTDPHCSVCEGVGTLPVPCDPLDTIQRLGQEFDAPEASPSLGMGENERAALVRAAEFLDSCAGADIEVDGVTAISVVEELHSLLPETWDDCFHVEAARYLEHLTSPSPDVGLAEENERLREALEEELRDAADTFEKLAASMREEDADLMAPEIAVCEMQRSRIRATLQSISTANGGPGRDGVS